MSLDSQIRKLFSEMEAINKRLEEIDTNGKFEEIQKSMARVEANSQVVVNTVESHGDTIGRLEKALTRLDLRCPLMKPDTGEFPDISERVRLKDE